MPPSNWESLSMAEKRAISGIVTRMAEPVYPFGAVLQHTSMHHVLWLCLGPASDDRRYDTDLIAMALFSDPSMKIGSIHTIGGLPRDWNVLEVIHVGPA